MKWRWGRSKFLIMSGHQDMKRGSYFLISGERALRTSVLIKIGPTDLKIFRIPAYTIIKG